MDGIKLAIQLDMPKEPEYKATLEERVEDAMEKVEYGTDRAAYKFLRHVNNCLAKRYKEGKRCDRSNKLLGTLTSFIAKHGLQDPEGVILAEEFVTNPDYEDSDGTRTMEPGDSKKGTKQEA